MSESVPIVIIAIAAILVVVALIALLFLKKQKGKLEQPIVRNKKAFFAQFAIGLILALVAAFFGANAYSSSKKETRSFPPAPPPSYQTLPKNSTRIPEND